ncbi:MAG: hypothetical protein QF824_04090 [Candidatus Woesearchaeota archaeon]|jgi:hypothetical protein|nr:hypothetical protein [Candidatus Woesearchaeota archaeon]
MKPIENFKPFRRIDYIAIIILAILWVIITSVSTNSDSELGFLFSLFITTVFIVFTAFLIKKAGAVTLFCLVGSTIAVQSNFLLSTGWNKVIIFTIAGIIFELFYIFLNKEIKNIPLDIVVGAAFAMSSIPFTIFFISQASDNIITSIFNFSLLSFIIGIVGAVATFLIWYNIKGNKLLIRFEYTV